MKAMARTTVEGVELEYEIAGAGEPVVLIHAGVCAGWFKPLMNEPALIGHYLVVRYHRVGYAGSSRIVGPVSFAQQARHCRSLMRNLGIDRAHIVGHSSSANMALQLALDAPEAVHSLVLMEPALNQVPSATGSARAFVVSALEQYRAGDKARAIDTFMRGVCGPGYRLVLEQAGNSGRLRPGPGRRRYVLRSGAPGVAGVVVQPGGCGPHYAAVPCRHWWEE